MCIRDSKPAIPMIIPPAEVPPNFRTAETGQSKLLHAEAKLVLHHQGHESQAAVKSSLFLGLGQLGRVGGHLLGFCRGAKKGAAGPELYARDNCRNGRSYGQLGIPSAGRNSKGVLPLATFSPFHCRICRSTGFKPYKQLKTPQRQGLV